MFTPEEIQLYAIRLGEAEFFVRMLTEQGIRKRRVEVALHTLR